MNSSVARGINNQGVVVGESYLPAGQGVHAVMWTVTPAVGGGNTTPTVTLAATGPTTINRGQVLSLRATMADPDLGDGPWSWSVAWGNGPTTGTVAQVGSFLVTRSYSKAGTYTVRIRVTDARGAMGTSNSVTIRVR